MENVKTQGTWKTGREWKNNVKEREWTRGMKDKIKKRVRKMEGKERIERDEGRNDPAWVSEEIMKARDWKHKKTQISN